MTGASIARRPATTRYNSDAVPPAVEGPPMTPAIETNQLTRDFREPGRLFRRASLEGNRALDGMSFSVEPGECVALVGPNGAGKSTLLRILATVILPTSGTARVCGYDVASQPKGVRRLAGVMTGDDRSFFWRLTGRENLLFFAELQGLSTTIARQRVNELLDTLSLSFAADRRFSGYSTGMRQRLGLARALLHHPRVLLLDEPTANLDLEHRGHVMSLLRSVLATGETTAMIASHDAGLAVSLANRVIRLDHGQITTASDEREPQRYLLQVRGLTTEQRQALMMSDDTDTLAIDDLGDGHALAAAVAAIVSGGGEIISVEPAGQFRAVR
ncbi:MAG TPA: ABC transporter ATP-binding protein [Thermomicrobiales bacterium]|nr:ABC transporter ATP-binding protein [Thermomicrobiales bacterium]